VDNFSGASEEIEKKEPHMNNERTNSTRIQNLPLLALAALMLFLTSGCTATLRNSELEKVAKDWSLVIRASQVIPVYPLTEDLQPGDVLLVSSPIEEQAALYKRKGFLPLDQHMVRLYSKDFKKFYGSRFGTKDNTIPPAQWQTPDDKGELNWKAAPHAGFPSYQFSAKRSPPGLEYLLVERFKVVSRPK
jgi:hypothetical protein